MKIDNDYLKKLLDACQSSIGPTFNILDLKEAGLDYEDPQFEFHMAILTDRRYPVLSKARHASTRKPWSLNLRLSRLRTSRPPR
jgi:hypothetical protein